MLYKGQQGQYWQKTWVHTNHAELSSIYTGGSLTNIADEVATCGHQGHTKSLKYTYYILDENLTQYKSVFSANGRKSKDLFVHMKWMIIVEIRPMNYMVWLLLWQV